MMPFQPDVLWQRLQSSPFRARFRLNAKDQTYLDDKGLPLILSHARDFIDRRLTAAHPKMTVSKRRCAATRCLSPNTPPPPAAAAAWKSGTAYRRISRSTNGKRRI